MGLGGSLINNWAPHVPRLSRMALWCATRVEMRLHRKPHWAVSRLASQLDYRAPVVTRLGNGMRIQVPWMDDGGRAIYEHEWYEPDTVRALSALLRPGAVFLDIGAAFGQYTLLGADAVGDSGQVHAFEPEPISHAWLAANVKRNHLRNVTLAQIALGDAPGFVDLYLGSPDNLGTTSLRQQYNYTGRSVRVEVKELDLYVALAGLSRVDVIKIDVEGAESLVFAGATKVLAMRPAMIIEFEESNQARFGSSCAELARLLTNKGYRLESLMDGQRVPYEIDHPKKYHSFNVVAMPL